MSRNCAAFAAIAIAMLGAIPAARADAIDGAWCSESGRRFAIEGPAVTTTKGIRLAGSYTRHSFSFTLPAEEPDAGSAVDMVLQGEMQVRVTIGAGGPPQIWRRCPPGVS